MSQSPTIYFVRHGQTDWNAELRLQGQRDIPINAKGRAQATHNGGTLAELIDDPSGFDFVASPLSRCIETMERVRTAMGLAPEAYRTDDRLMEFAFGDWEGRSWPELRAEEPELVAERARDPFHFAPPGDGAESYADLTTRIVACFNEITRDTVIVSHGGVSRALRGYVLGLPNEETTELKVPQDKVMRIWNGTTAWF